MCEIRVGIVSAIGLHNQSIGDKLELGSEHTPSEQQKRKQLST